MIDAVSWWVAFSGEQEEAVKVEAVEPGSKAVLSEMKRAMVRAVTLVYVARSVVAAGFVVVVVVVWMAVAFVFADESVGRNDHQESVVRENIRDHRSVHAVQGY